jgi:hypothetical protein
MAWRDTLLAQEHEEVFEDGEWIWADSEYPVCFLIYGANIS